MPCFARFVTYTFIVLNQTADKKKKKPDLKGTPKWRRILGRCEEGSSCFLNRFNPFLDNLCHPSRPQNGGGRDLWEALMEESQTPPRFPFGHFHRWENLRLFWNLPTGEGVWIRHVWSHFGTQIGSGLSCRPQSAIVGK